MKNVIINATIEHISSKWMGRIANIENTLMSVRIYGD